MSANLRFGTAQLFRALQCAIGAEDAAQELRWMKDALRKHPSSPMRPRSLDSMLERRVKGEPLQYIIGTQPFGPLELLVRPPVLIPRPETEDWTIRILQQLSPSRDRPVSVLDLCTGTGCIPLLLCRLWPPGSVHATGVDISEDAIRLARDNAELCGVMLHEPGQNDAVPVDIAGDREHNWFRPILADIRDPDFVRKNELQRPFDVITSNPPYISKRDYEKLPSSVKDYEDWRALLGDDPGVDGQGLTFYHDIIGLLSNGELEMLKKDGIVVLEVGEGQAGDVAESLERRAQLRDIKIWKDPWGKERVVIGRYHN
ncbi:S-adenosyl-L-methionine-dependent methyltransferase [Laetiporus sulphureus 93-53]|uniref:S-adenosyl-L-methionine-dependent methyltransferase n=1 Tax=Laetiporus sulphureus 93-53 TaxID=1314785 RepID=A0A165F4G8_9APHY|nr:S-adenosyl-L-methionine-dependent methyltransferase [Laetiporus sulphureus 93-53]KZT08367.1 S-adenosyl-L-methionine-dependent methyltransferase [Laetiporus sulphureus 93-53]